MTLGVRGIVVDAEGRVEQPIGRARVELSLAVERKTDELTSRTVNEPKGYLRWTRAF